MLQTNDLHITETVPLPTSDALKSELPISPAVAETVYRIRGTIRALLRGDDPRVLVVVGPCSIHDPVAALEYARELNSMARELREELVVVMRVYFEKPRTNVGWKGLVNDPHLDGSYDIASGLRRARQLLLEVGTIGLPAATEMLDPIVPQYIADLISWAAIGARTTESQTHREMASGLSMPVGFKNGTDGDVDIAVNAMISASRPHRFLGVDGQGRVSVISTQGNADCHLVLRGGSSGPNYHQAAVSAAVGACAAAGAPSRALIDCSHDNSNRCHERQGEALSEVARQIQSGSRQVLGIMLESNLVAGKQSFIGPGQDLVYGQSITDACIDLQTTHRLLVELARASRVRSSKAA